MTPSSEDTPIIAPGCDTAGHTQEFSVSAKSRLTRHDLGRFGGTTLFDRLGRAVCEAEVLPRKELFEAWEVARRVRRLFRGGRVVDAAGGHGLLAYALLLFDNSSSDAFVVDPAPPPSASALAAAIVSTWPRLSGRVHGCAQSVVDFPLLADDLVVSVHACGALTDRILERAVSARARVAVLPCCHDRTTSTAEPLTGWMDVALAIDANRAVGLERAGYRVWTQQIPAAITPKNRLLIGAPHTESAV